MTGSVLIQHDKSILHKWLGGNRGTHWIVAGIVAVIVLGSYLIHSMSAALRMSAPMAPAPPAPLTTESEIIFHCPVGRDEKKRESHAYHICSSSFRAVQSK